MLRERANYFNVFWRICDLLVLFLCFVLSYYIRFSFFPLYFQAIKIPTFGSYLPNITLLLVLWLFIAETFGLYKSKRIQTPAADWRIILTSILFTVFLYASVGFIFKSFDISRLLLSIFAFCSFVVLGIWHNVFRILLSYIRAKGFNKRNILIIGAGQIGRRFAYEISIHRSMGYNILGFLDDDSDKNMDMNFKILGMLSEIRTILENNVVDRVVVALGHHESKHIENVIHECEYAGVEVNVIPDLFQYIHPNAKVLNLNGIPLIGLHPNPVDSWQYAYLKRAFDILFSFSILFFTSPIMLTLMLLIKMTSKGPIFFIQKRLGTHGRPFKFYKFRTMIVAPVQESDTRWTLRDDERITFIGRFMRKTSLDELPQFWNILKGEMSVVGPRPERPHFARKFRENIPEYMLRHQVKTGLTGWAQVNGFRGDTSIEKRIKFDLYYIENWSFTFDLRIIFLTLLRGIIHKNAY